jgi:glycosyltransferase involved in cell wall biosynthesis
MIPPKVSVLVPVFNGARHLAECLDSILTQDFRDLEILLGDDGSTDESPQIIQSFAARDPRIRWWTNPHNHGLTGNSNVCLRAARGDYIKFVHQDDKLLAASAIRKMAAALDEQTAAALVGSRQHLTGTNSQPTVFSERAGCFNGRQMIVTSLEQNANLIGQPTLTMFRRRQAQRGFDERFTGFMDFEMWCHLLEQGDYAYLAEPLATWRVHQHHQTHRARTTKVSDQEHLRFLEIYFDKPWLQAAATDRMLFAQIYYLKKNYGRQAERLTSAMMTQLTPRRYVWQWLKHKATRPLQKLSRKLRRR